MAFWRRIPKGAYSRATPDWFAHQRARVSVQLNTTGNYYPAMALINNSSPPMYLHVIGMFLLDFDNPVTLFGKYIGNTLTPNPNNDVPLISAATAIYSDDPMPPGYALAGCEPNPTFNDPLLYDAGYGTYIYPPWEIAVIAPNQGFELYSDNHGDASIGAVFDYIWMLD